MDPAGLPWLFHLMAFVKLGGQHGTPARAEGYCLSPISSPISISPGAKLREKKLVQIFIIVLKEPIFYPPHASLDTVKVGKKSCWLQQQFHYCGQSSLNRIIVDNLIASLPQLLSF